MKTRALKVEYTTTEVAEMLELSPRTIRRWCKRGDLKAHRVGKDYRIPLIALRENVDRWDSLLFKNQLSDSIEPTFVRYDENKM